MYLFAPKTGDKDLQKLFVHSSTTKSLSASRCILDKQVAPSRRQRLNLNVRCASAEEATYLTSLVEPAWLLQVKK